MPKKKEKRWTYPVYALGYAILGILCQPFSASCREDHSAVLGEHTTQLRMAWARIREDQRMAQGKKDTRCTWPASNKPMFILSIDFLLERESIQITRRKVLAQDDYFVLKSLHADVSPTLSFVTRREAAVAICHLGGVGGILVMSR